MRRALDSQYEHRLLSALDSHIAVLDSNGNITHVNQAWVEFAQKNGAAASSTGVGVNYFEVCRARGATTEVEQILSGIQAVLHGSAPHFTVEYACPSPTKIFWFELSVNPLREPERGVVVCHSDISDLKRTRDEYAVVLESARAILWRASLPGFRTTFTSKHVEKILGFPTEAWLTNPSLWIHRIHPEDRDWVIAFTGKATEEQRNHEFEYRMIAADGHTVWLRNIVNVVVENGRVAEVVGISIDVSERKHAEEVLSMMSRRSVQAQERERKRIARELHDDINQRLALMSVDLEELLKKHHRLSSEVRNAVMSVSKRTIELSSDIETLSHQLHSSKLEYIGLVKAMEGFCREFGEKHAMEIDFRKQDLPNSPSQEVSVCLFRVLQEALSNAAKYSGVKNLQVELAPRSGQVHLRISDSGRGFDLEKVMEGAGLGVTSMQERVRLVNGSIEIKSKPMGGTTINVVIPLEGESQQLAG